MMKKPLVLVSCVILLVTLGAPASASDDDRASAFSPDSRPQGMTYAQWQGAYQVWLNEIPTPENPIVDPASARNCELQRRGRAAYLGALGARCSIPEGVASVLSGPFWECSTAEGLGETFAELRRCARENFRADFGPKVMSIRVEIDGRRLKHPRRFVVQSPGEIIDFPEDNIWGAVPGPSKSVTRGLLLVLRPMSEGVHRVVIETHDDQFGDFRVVWRLNVVDD
jgi:hypothetical protein